MSVTLTFLSLSIRRDFMGGGDAMAMQRQEAGLCCIIIRSHIAGALENKILN